MTADGAQRLVDKLRGAFDSGFAAPAATEGGTRVDLLGIRVAGHRYALPLADIESIARCPRVTTLPSRAPALAGLAGVRGALVAVYSLGALLGHGISDAGRWVVLQGDVALMFDEIEAYHRVAPRELHPLAAEIGARDHLHRMLRVADTLIPVVDVASVLGTIGGGSVAGAPVGEQRS